MLCYIFSPNMLKKESGFFFFFHIKTITAILIHLGDKTMLLHYTVPRVKLVSSSSFADNYRISSYFFFYYTFLTRSESNSLAARLNFPEL